MKKLTVILLSLLLFISILAPNAFADGEVYTEGFFYYTVKDQSITITGYFGNETEVTVPAMIAGIPVNAIAPGAFDGTTVQIIHLPDTIMEVPEDVGDNTRISGDVLTDKPNEQVDTSNASNENHENNANHETVMVEDKSDDQGFGIQTEPAKGDASLSNQGSANSTAEMVVVNEPPFEEETNEPEPTPEASETPENTAEPEATPEAEEPAAEKSGSAIGWIIGAAVLVCGGAAVIVLKKKGGKA